MYGKYVNEGYECMRAGPFPAHEVSNLNKRTMVGFGVCQTVQPRSVFSLYVLRARCEIIRKIQVEPTQNRPHHGVASVLSSFPRIHDLGLAT